MRILFLAPKVNLDTPSGGTLHYTDLTESMSRINRNDDVYLIASGKNNTKKRKGNLTVIVRKDIDTSFIRLRRDVKKIQNINSIISEIDPDFLYFRTEPFELFPAFLETKASSMIEISYNLFAKSYDVSRLISVLWPVRNAALSIWMKSAVKNFDCVITVSESNRKSLERRIDKKIYVIGTGANTRKVKMRQSSRNPDRIIFVGNSLKYQGVHVLLEASRILTTRDVNHEVWIVGKYDKSRYKAATNVKFLGPLPNKEALSAMTRCSIGTASYLEAKNEPYGFSPVKILEYMAAGLAVVATDTEWNRELIKKKNGLLFRSGDAEDLAAKLEGLLKNRQKLADIQAANRSEARGVQNWDEKARELTRIIKAATNARK